MTERFSRTALLLGEDKLAKLSQSKVAVFGLGGVGGSVVEALARSGVGTLDLVDADVVSESNLNRQILALTDTVGRLKAEVAVERVKRINPDICANERIIFFDESTADSFDFTAYDYVVDAIDTVSSKLLLAELCTKAHTPVICCLGTGNKLNPMGFKVSDIYYTKVCPLARVMRTELKKRGIPALKVVWSEEPPHKAVIADNGRHAPASVAFVPPAAGLLIAAEVIKDLTSI